MKSGSHSYAIPSAAQISTSQNKFSSLRLLLAQRRLYSIAKRWSFLRAIGVGLIAIIAPLVTLRWPGASVILGALAGTWIVASRTIFVTCEKRYAAKGAIVQERFDAQVFGMPATDFRAHAVTPEDISRIVGPDVEAQREIECASLMDWYPIDAELDGPTSIAIAQRANAAYAERLLGVHALVWLWVMVVWSLLIIGLSIGLGLSFSTFLLGVALPLLPALLDVADQWRTTLLAREERLQLANAIEQAINNIAARHIVADDLLRWQDQLFILRRDSPQVPNIIYWRTRKANELAMTAAAKELAALAKKSIGRIQ